MSGWHELGLDADSGELYRAMLAAPGAALTTLAAALGRELRLVRQDAVRLQESGLVRLEGDAALPVPPELGISTLISSVEQEIARRQDAIMRARQSLPALVDAYLEGHSNAVADAPYEELTRPAAVRSRIFRLAADAVESALSLVPGEAFSPQATAASQRVDEELLSRGVRVEYVVSLESCLAGYWRDYLDAITAAGAHVRVHPSPPMLAVVFDETTALLPRAEHRGALVLNGSDIAAPVIQLFRQTWGDATPYEELAGHENALSPRHHRALVLLGEGLTDEVIARRMNVSSRTVRRLVAELCATLQAHSRFEAGAEAVRRGLLPARCSGASAD